MKPWWHEVRAGDWVVVEPAYNRSVYHQNRLPYRVRVTRVEHGRVSQTHTMLTIDDGRGGTVRMDAGWFTGIAR